MENTEPLDISLETHETKDVNDKHVNGKLTVVWRDYDNLIKTPPKMVYVSSVNAHEIKGPHVHTKRESYFVCISGKVIFIIKNHDGSYSEIESSEDKPTLVHVPKNTASAHINIHDDVSHVLALADIAWKPNDNEMINTIFDDFDWKKFDNIHE